MHLILWSHLVHETYNSIDHQLKQLWIWKIPTNNWFSQAKPCIIIQTLKSFDTILTYPARIQIEFVFLNFNVYTHTKYHKIQSEKAYSQKVLWFWQNSCRLQVQIEWHSACLIKSHLQVFLFGVCDKIFQLIDETLLINKKNCKQKSLRKWDSFVLVDPLLKTFLFSHYIISDIRIQWDGCKKTSKADSVPYCFLS